MKLIFMTRLVLDDFEFGGKKLQILNAMSGTEAREILAKEPKYRSGFR